MKRTMKSVALVATFLLGLNNSVSADDISVFVKDSKGREIANAVVMLTPMFETDVSFSPATKAEMRQENTLFKPFVLPVKTGSK